MGVPTMATHSIKRDTCVVRDTGSHKGRKWRVEPGGTAARYLYYGRIILSNGDAPIRFETKDRETGLICLKGSAQVKAEGQGYNLSRFDTLYVPRDASIEVTPGSDGCDLADRFAMSKGATAPCGHFVTGPRSRASAIRPTRGPVRVVAPPSASR